MGNELLRMITFFLEMHPQAIVKEGKVYFVANLFADMVDVLYGDLDIFFKLRMVLFAQPVKVILDYLFASVRVDCL